LFFANKGISAVRRDARVDRTGVIVLDIPTLCLNIRDGIGRVFRKSIGAQKCDIGIVGYDEELPVGR
jgi:hypothetical protein